MFFPRHYGAYGGTEYMIDGFNVRLGNQIPKFSHYQTVAMPGMMLDPFLLMEKPSILWLHNLPNQFGPNHIGFLSSKHFYENISKVVVPSEYSRSVIEKISGYSGDHVEVIPNAITPLKYDSQKFEKIGKPQLIYISGAMRGLEFLLYATQHIEEDFDLHIFSDWQPYVTDFLNNLKPVEEAVKIINEDSRITVYGRVPNVTIRKFLEKSHILAYPSIYQETFCLSLAESLSAGLRTVVPQLGALPEIGNGFIGDFDWQGTFKEYVDEGYGPEITNFTFQYPDNYRDNLEAYAKELTKAIQQVKAGEHDPTEQVKTINGKYSWETVTKQWLDFHDRLD